MLLRESESVHAVGSSALLGSVDLLTLIFMPQSPPRTADGISVCFPSQRQICQLTNSRVMLNNLMQRDNHAISDRKRASREKLPRTVFSVA